MADAASQNKDLRGVIEMNDVINDVDDHGYLKHAEEERERGDDAEIVSSNDETLPDYESRHIVLIIGDVDRCR